MLYYPHNIMNEFSQAITIILTTADSLVPYVTLEDILIFITGASAVPPLGFEPSTTVCFVESECLPFASSCDNVHFYIFSCRLQPFQGENELCFMRLSWVWQFDFIKLLVHKTCIMDILRSCNPFFCTQSLSHVTDRTDVVFQLCSNLTPTIRIL